MNLTDLITRNQKSLAGRKPGDIIFFHPITFNFFAMAILFFTGEYYDHGAIVVDENTVIEADPFLGVHTNDIAPYMNEYILDLHRLKDDTVAPNIVPCAQKYLGWEYDYGNVLWAGLGFIILRLTGISIFRKIKNPFDGSQKTESEEYIDLVFKDAGINLCRNIPPTNVSAQTLADSPLLSKLNS